jgi:hypothetical protein
MTTAEFLAHLRSLGILLSLQGDRLRCSAPKGALTPEIREALALRKTEILDLLRVTSDPRRGAGSHPLSFAQQRMWFIEQLTPGTPLTTPRRLAAHGRLGPSGAGGKPREIVTRHDALRTTFAAVDGRSRSSPRPLLPGGGNLGGIPRERREDHALRLATEEARQPFDLVRGPLFRSRLIRLDLRTISSCSAAIT